MGVDAADAGGARAEPQPPISWGALTAWAALVGVLIALAYAANLAAPGPPDADVLYRYSTAVAALVQYALMLAIVLWIARGLPRETLGYRRPSAWPRALGLTLAGLLGIWAAGAALDVYLEAGEEQGLVPDGWDATRAGPFVANFVVIAVVAPIVEETTYRGLGFAAVSARFGALAGVLVTGVAFGLSHGLVVALPVLSLFGIILAALRWRTGSLYPPIVLHAAFNAVALLAAVTVAGGSA